MKHGMILDAFSELYSPDGKLLKTIGNAGKVEKEGEISVKIFDGNNKIKHEQKAPMRSLIYNFFRLFDEGGTLNTPSWGTASNFTTIGLGTGAGDVSFTGNLPLTHTNAAMTLLDYSAGLPTWNSVSGTIDIDLQVRLLKTSSGTITVTNIGLYGTRTGLSNSRGLWIHDVVSPFSFSQNDVAQLNFTLKFPASSTRTLTKNILNWMMEPWHPSSLQYRDKDNNLLSISGKTSNMYGNGSTTYSMTFMNGSTSGFFTASGLDYKHICIGAGSSLCDMDDYTLETPIADGSSSGALSYINATHALNYSSLRQGNSGYIRTFRDFVNNGTENVTVREAGIFSSPYTNWFNPQTNFLLSRWLTGDIVVEPGQSLRVYWNPRITLEA